MPSAQRCQRAQRRARRLHRSNSYLSACADASARARTPNHQRVQCGDTLQAQQRREQIAIGDLVRERAINDASFPRVRCVAHCARTRTLKYSRKRNTVNGGSDVNCSLKDTCSALESKRPIVIADRSTNNIRRTTTRRTTEQRTRDTETKPHIENTQIRAKLESVQFAETVVLQKYCSHAREYVSDVNVLDRRVLAVGRAAQHCRLRQLYRLRRQSIHLF